MENRKVKSNRAQADYFELMICQHICQEFNVPFIYTKNLAELSNQVLTLPNGRERLKLQNDNLIKVIPKINEILQYEIKINKKGKIIEVIWVGRKIIIKTTSDIDVKHYTTRFTKFSVKSIYKTGFGTIKNLGMKFLQEYLEVDFKKEYEKMWKELKDFLKRKGINLQSKSEIKKLVLGDNEFLEWAKNNGEKYQVKLNDTCFKKFNSLSQYEKCRFLNKILDADDPDLYVIIVNSKGVTVYRPIEKLVGRKQKIEAKENTRRGYTIYIDEVPSYRIQTNATNGIGISPFCQRIFFAEYNKK